ncbi:MAG: hypothetical protein ACREC9_13610 [Methylocella sp.]
MAGEITVQVDYKRAVVKLESLSPDVRASLYDIELPLGVALVERIKSKIHSRTGKMAKRVRGRVKSNAKGVITTVGSYAPHAHLIEGGAHLPARDIVANAKMAMYFQSGGANVFAKRVHFPGGEVKAQHPVHSAFGEMKQEIAGKMREAVAFAVAKGNS